MAGQSRAERSSYHDPRDCRASASAAMADGITNKPPINAPQSRLQDQRTGGSPRRMNRHLGCKCVRSGGATDLPDQR